MSVLERVREQESRGVANDMSAVADTSGTEGLSVTLKHELVSRLGLATVATMVAMPDMEQARAELRVTCQAILTSGHSPLRPILRRPKAGGYMMPTVTATTGASLIPTALRMMYALSQVLT